MKLRKCSSPVSSLSWRVDASRVTLIAGTRPEVKERFEGMIHKEGYDLENGPIQILHKRKFLPNISKPLTLCFMIRISCGPSPVSSPFRGSWDSPDLCSSHGTARTLQSKMGHRERCRNETAEPRGDRGLAH